MSRLPVPFPALVAVAALSLAAVPFGAAAHGAGEGAENFEEHLDDYADEVQRLGDEAAAIVDDVAAGRELDGDLDGLIDTWEEVEVHLAIELHATPLYPGVWQALIAFRQAVEAGAPEDELRQHVADLRASLWQGLGALKLAATQEREDHDDSAGEAEPAAPESPQETIAAIQRSLDEAVAAYDEGEVERAEQMIHRAYMDRFEGLEGDLIAEDAELVADLEAAFNARLPLLMQRGAEMDEVRAELEDMKASLDRAGELLRNAERDRSEVF